MKTPISLIKKEQIRTRIIKMSLTTLLLLFITQYAVAQTVHTVDNRVDSGAMFTTIQTAITASVAGDTIYIHPSTKTYGHPIVNKSLTFIGLGHNPENTNNVKATVGFFQFSGSTPNTVIKGLTFSGINPYTTSNMNGLEIKNCRITQNINGTNGVGIGDDWLITGNFFSSTAVIMNQVKSTKWIIANNYIRGTMSSLDQYTVFLNNIVINTKAGTPTIFTSCNLPTVSNNLFLFTGTATGMLAPTVEFTNNLTWSYSGATLTTLATTTGGTNYDNEKPIFENAPDESVNAFYPNDYRLATGSPGILGGFDGTDIGLFGRNFVYDVNGRVDLLPYPTFIDISNIVVSPGQDLNVIFKASIKQ